MRRQLNWLALAVTALVVVAFVVPLALLVRRQATERAQVAAEQRAQAAAAVLAVSVAGSSEPLTEDSAEAALVTDVGIVLPDGAVIGAVRPDPQVTDGLTGGQTTARFTAEGSWQVGIPVLTPAGVAGVLAEAAPEDMSRGVTGATVWLALLGLGLVAGSVLLTDRLGRSMVDPVRGLADVADRLADGRLDARAEESGPPEIRAVAAALNGLASRLESIIEGEREALADLSHRLRTPITALRLEVDRFQADSSPSRILVQVDRVQEAVDQLIREVRNRGKGPRDSVEVVSAVERRVAFWSVLAQEQDREIDVRLDPGPIWVGVSESELAAALDAVVGNIFSHTPAGTPFTVVARRDHTTPVLEVWDAGPGFPPGVQVTRRGASAAGSTGLGLDIAVRMCQKLGGELKTDEGPGGGALVVMRLGP